MGLFNQFPYTNFHELNLDWIIKAINTLSEELKNFVALNTIKYANPIIWDITKQYEKNTVVLDNDGNAYLSVQPVPEGVSLDREDYWTKIGNFSALWDSVRSAITPYDEQHSTTATADRSVGDWVWQEHKLLYITKAISAGDKYVEGSNCTDTNIMTLYNNLRDSVDTATVNLTKLVAQETTERKAADTSISDALTQEISDRKDADAALKTDIENANNIVFFEKYGAVGDGVTDDTTAIKNAVADAEENSKFLASLAKTYYVSDTISIDCNKVKNINIIGTIKADFTDKTIVKFYTSDAATITNANITCKVDGTAGYGGYSFPAEDEEFNFTDIAQHGIDFLDINRSVIHCSASNCGIGLEFTNTSAHGVVFNTVTVDDVYNCVIGLDLHSNNNGWVNSNVFVNSGFQIDSTLNTYEKRTIAIRLLGTSHNINSNIFIAPSFETRGLPILFDNASYNRITAYRAENNTTYYAKFINNSQLNSMQSLYGQLQGAIIGLESRNIITNVSNDFISNCSRVKKWSFDRNKCFNVGTRGAIGSKTIIKGLDHIDTSKNMTQPVYWNVSIGETQLNISGHECVGTLVDCSTIKTFFYASDSSVGVFIVPLDENKTFIEEAPTGFTFANIWKGGANCYRMSPSNRNITSFTVSDNAKYVFIGFGGSVSWFDIFCLTTRAQSNFGSVAPTLKMFPDIGSATIPNSTITSKCTTGTMLPACDPTGTALAYICTDGDTQTWEEIKKPT